MIITTRKIPFRIVLRDRKPMVVEVLVRNNAPRERKYVISLDTGHDLSVAPTGLARFDTKKIQTLYPGERATVAFKIYPRPTTKPGNYTVYITVDECVDDYNHVVESKEISIRVPII